MKKFMAIYMAPAAEFENMMRSSTPEQQRKGMEAWMKWMNENKASIVEGGAPLGKTKRADATGVSDVKNNVGGYSIVQAETHEAAAKLFGKDHPHLHMPGAWVEILVAAGKAANLEGGRPLPSIARFRTASISDARGGNEPRCART